MGAQPGHRPRRRPGRGEVRDAARRARRCARGSDARGRLPARRPLRRRARPSARSADCRIGAPGDARGTGRPGRSRCSCTTPPCSTIPVSRERLQRRRGWRPRTLVCRREVRSQLVELRASRRRLLRARDDERASARAAAARDRRAPTDRARAHSGGSTRDGRRRARTGASRSSSPVRSRSWANSPRVSIRGGWAKAASPTCWRSLVARGPVPVDLSVPDVGLPEEVATAAYFVCSEALANVGKYARASRVTISVRASDGARAGRGAR